LRLAHSPGNPFKTGEKIIIDKMKIENGKIQELEFRSQKEMTTMDPLTIPFKDMTLETWKSMSEENQTLYIQNFYELKEKPV